MDEHDTGVVDLSVYRSGRSEPRADTGIRRAKLAPADEKPALDVPELLSGLREDAPMMADHGMRVAMVARSAARKLSTPVGETELIFNAAALHEIAAIAYAKDWLSFPFRNRLWLSLSVFRDAGQDGIADLLIVLLCSDPLDVAKMPQAAQIIHYAVTFFDEHRQGHAPVLVIRRAMQRRGYSRAVLNAFDEEPSASGGKREVPFGG